MLEPNEFNKIITEMHDVAEWDLPYCKGMIDRKEVVKILRKHTDFGVGKTNLEK